MSKFVIQPHFRLQEWVAEEKGYFKNEGLDYVFQEEVLKTDGKIHETGLEEPDDAYRGYNPPTLRGVYDKDPYLHDGRSKTLLDALAGPHEPDSVTGLGTLSDEEMSDLIEYLKAL